MEERADQQIRRSRVVRSERVDDAIRTPPSGAMREARPGLVPPRRVGTVLARRVFETIGDAGEGETVPEPTREAAIQAAQADAIEEAASRDDVTVASSLRGALVPGTARPSLSALNWYALTSLPLPCSWIFTVTGSGFARGEDLELSADLTPRGQLARLWRRLVDDLGRRGTIVGDRLTTGRLGAHPHDVLGPLTEVQDAYGDYVLHLLPFSVDVHPHAVVPRDDAHVPLPLGAPPQLAPQQSRLRRRGC
jgi:hypothetical protein